MMSVQQIIRNLTSFTPPSPEVVARSSGNVTLQLNSGPFSCLGDQLMFTVQRKEKIPPWVVVYSGGKSTKTIDNLAPSHPHRFRVRIIIKSISKLIQSNEDYQNVIEEMSKMDDKKYDKQISTSSDVDESKLLFQQASEGSKKLDWAESRWSEETWVSTDSSGASAACFCMAVRCGYLKQVSQMLEERPELVGVVNSHSGLTPLATAVNKGDVSMVRLLLCSGAELEQRSSSGQTALLLSVLSSHLAVADLLLERGADLQARDLNRLRVEHYAVDSCNLDVVKFVMERGGDVTARDSNGWTPLFRAVCQGAKTDIIEELVRRGSDIEILDKANLSLAAAARLLKDRHGRRRESVLRLVDSQFQHEKVVANFTRLTKKISSVNTLLTRTVK